MDSDNLFTLEALFDEDAVFSYDINFFKDEVLKEIQTTGKQLEVQDAGRSLLVKVIDPLRSQGYNTFKTNEDYNDWLQASMYEPTQDQMEEALNGNGA